VDEQKVYEAWFNQAHKDLVRADKILGIEEWELVSLPASP
jgi:hypothetical protein